MSGENKALGLYEKGQLSFELSKAILDGERQKINQLLERKDVLEWINVNYNGYAPIHRIAQSNKLHDYVQKFKEVGADIEARSYWNWTPLMLAATNFNRETVAVFIEHGANINASNSDKLKKRELKRKKVAPSTGKTFSFPLATPITLLKDYSSINNPDYMGDVSNYSERDHNEWLIELLINNSNRKDCLLAIVDMEMTSDNIVNTVKVLERCTTFIESGCLARDEIKKVKTHRQKILERNTTNNAGKKDCLKSVYYQKKILDSIDETSSNYKKEKQKYGTAFNKAISGLTLHWYNKVSDRQREKRLKKIKNNIQEFVKDFGISALEELTAPDGKGKNMLDVVLDHYKTYDVEHHKEFTDSLNKNSKQKNSTQEEKGKTEQKTKEHKGEEKGDAVCCNNSNFHDIGGKPPKTNISRSNSEEFSVIKGQKSQLGEVLI